MNNLGERLNDMCSLILRLVYLNLLWILFTLAGFVVFGLGPATYAMLSVMRQWIRGNQDITIFKSYLKEYKSGFKESTLMGVLYQAVGFIIYIDLLYVQAPFLRGILFLASFLFIVSLCFIFPILVHYDWKSAFYKIKYSILIGISYLQYTLVLFLALAIVYFLLLLVPGVLPFLGVSIGGYMTMWMTNQVFNKIENQARIREEPLIKGGGEA
jgi:uncharacterized membrane protein YesL